MTIAVPLHLTLFGRVMCCIWSEPLGTIQKVTCGIKMQIHIVLCQTLPTHENSLKSYPTHPHASTLFVYIIRDLHP